MKKNLRYIPVILATIFLIILLIGFLLKFPMTYLGEGTGFFIYFIGLPFYLLFILSIFLIQFKRGIITIIASIPINLIFILAILFESGFKISFWH
jgi:hypothetical protein